MDTTDGQQRQRERKKTIRRAVQAIVRVTRPHSGDVCLRGAGGNGRRLSQPDVSHASVVRRVEAIRVFRVDGPPIERGAVSGRVAVERRSCSGQDVGGGGGGTRQLDPPADDADDRRDVRCGRRRRTSSDDDDDDERRPRRRRRPTPGHAGLGAGEPRQRRSGSSAAAGWHGRAPG